MITDNPGLKSMILYEVVILENNTLHTTNFAAEKGQVVYDHIESEGKILKSVINKGFVNVIL